MNVFNLFYHNAPFAALFIPSKWFTLLLALQSY